MSKTIKLTPELLEAQAASMRELSEAQQAYNARIKSTVNKMNEGLTAVLRHNISLKTTVMMTQANGAASLLSWAVTAITKVIEEFARTQQTLKDLFDTVFGDILPREGCTVAEQNNNKQAQLMEDMLAKNERIDTSRYSRATYYDYYDSTGTYKKNWGLYNSTDGCTWYAYNRYQEMNPNIGSMFAGDGGGGNAANWVNSIDRNKFNVFETSDHSVIRGNSIAVSTQADVWEEGIRASSNHVAYVEAVKDGYVYYTDGSYGSPESAYGYVQKVPIDIFAKDYEFIVSAK